MSWLIYFIKVMVMQLAAYLGYRLLLDNERAGQLKRAYLLASMTLAYLVPFVVVSRIKVACTELGMTGLPESPLTNIAPTIPFGVPEAGLLRYFEVSISTVFIATILLIYLAGVIYHLVKLANFLLLIRKRVSGGKKGRSNGLVLVPLDDASSPHSFFHWCFYPENSPPNSLILAHELAHARQYHSLDRLVVALFRSIFWFNPVHLLFERAIIVNHELLADQAVLRAGCDPTIYQTALLTTLSATPVASPFVSGAGFHLTKKRFQMMNSTSGNRLISASKFLPALSLWGLLLFSFGQIGYAQVAPPPPPPPPPPSMDGTAMKVLSPTTRQLSDWQNTETYGVWIDGKRVANSVLVDYTAEDFGYYNLSKLARNAVNYGKHVYQLDLMTNAAFEKFKVQMEMDGMPLPPPPPPPVPSTPPGLKSIKVLVPTANNLKEWQDSKTYGVWIDGKRVENSLLTNYSADDFGYYQKSKLESNAANYGQNVYRLDLMTNAAAKKFRIQMEADGTPLPPPPPPTPPNPPKKY